MTKMGLASIAVLALGALGGCHGGGVRYGDPMPPTGGQMSAGTSLNGISTNVSGAVSGMSDGNKAFGVFDLMAGLQGTATNQGSSQGLSLAPSDLPAACVTGTPATGFTYNNCMYGSGTTLNGSVQITTTSVTYDLTVRAGVSGATTDITLSGTVSDVANHLTGNLEYKTHIDVAGVGGLGGLGGGSADTSVTADWDIMTTECGVSSGIIEVKVDNANGTHGAKFNFTACNTFTVQNG